MMTVSVEQMRLSPNRLKDLENQLFSLARTQSKRQTPADLPSSLFWDQLTQLVQHIEIELDEAMQRDGWGAKTQMLQRRQGNVRRAIGELTRNRLNAFVGHATMVQLSGEGAAANATSIDWTRHTPAERAFHDGVARLVDRYKADIDWRQLQRGLVASQSAVPSTPSGTAPLTQFTDTLRPAANSLSPLDNSLDNSNPKADFSSESFSTSDGTANRTKMVESISSTPNPNTDLDGFADTAADWHDDDFDFEPEPFEPEPLLTESNPATASETEAVETQSAEIQDAQTQSAETQDAQSTSPETESESEEDIPNQEDSESSEESAGNMIRIRILKDLSEPLIDESGAEIELLEGDIHQCASLLGETLISAGFAEEAAI
jgi:hypothetical protein